MKLKTKIVLISFFFVTGCFVLTSFVNNIKKIELKKLSLQNRFANEKISAEEIKELSIALKEVENTLEEKTNQWLDYSIKMEG